MPVPTIKEALYRVTGSFGQSNEGDMRITYRMGKDDGSDRVLLFHPKDKHGSGSFEFARVSRDSVNRMIPIYETDRVGTNNATNENELFINLSASEEKFYRGVVEATGLKIPKNLLLNAAEPQEEAEPARPRRKLR